MNKLLDGTKRLIALIITLTFCYSVIFALHVDKVVGKEITYVYGAITTYYFLNDKIKLKSDKNE